MGIGSRHVDERAEAVVERRRSLGRLWIGEKADESFLVGPPPEFGHGHC
jgi:hypothetical protein